jgi:hypothetical protein
MRPEDEERLRRIGVQTIISKADGLDLVLQALRLALKRRQVA